MTNTQSATPTQRWPWTSKCFEPIQRWGPWRQSNNNKGLSMVVAPSHWWVPYWLVGTTMAKNITRKCKSHIAKSSQGRRLPHGVPWEQHWPCRLLPRGRQFCRSSFSGSWRGTPRHVSSENSTKTGSYSTQCMHISRQTPLNAQWLNDSMTTDPDWCKILSTWTWHLLSYLLKDTP